MDGVDGARGAVHARDPEGARAGLRHEKARVRQERRKKVNCKPVEITKKNNKKSTTKRGKEEKQK